MSSSLWSTFDSGFSLFAFSIDFVACCIHRYIYFPWHLRYYCHVGVVDTSSEAWSGCQARIESSYGVGIVELPCALQAVHQCSQHGRISDGSVCRTWAGWSHEDDMQGVSVCFWLWLIAIAFLLLSIRRLMSCIHQHLASSHIATRIDIVQTLRFRFWGLNWDLLMIWNARDSWRQLEWSLVWIRIADQARSDTSSWIQRQRSLTCWRQERSIRRLTSKDKSKGHPSTPFQASHTHHCKPHTRTLHTAAFFTFLSLLFFAFSSLSLH